VTVITRFRPVWLPVATLSLLAGCAGTPPSSDGKAGTESRLDYPTARRVDQVDAFHGVQVADPYRWLEELDSPETRSWIDAQNKVTDSVLKQLPLRQALTERMTQLWEYERYGIPRERGGRYFYTRQAPGQNQPVLYSATALDAEPTLLLDPNTLSTDGTQAVSDWVPSPDGKLLAWAAQSGGSDWKQWRVRNIETGEDLPDVIEWSKFSGASWAADSSGFYYSAYDAPTGENKLKAVNENQKLYFHRIGTPQSADLLAYARPDEPKWGFQGQVSDDGRWLIITVSLGTDERNQLFVQDLKTPGSPVRPLIDRFEASYNFIDSMGSTLLLMTNLDAERSRLIAVDLARPARDQWLEVIPEDAATLVQVSRVGDVLLARYLKDAQTVLRRYTLDGEPQGEVALPGIGTAVGFDGGATDTQTFYSYSSYTTPAQIHRLDIRSGQSQLFRKPELALDSSTLETRQVFYTAADGTRIPMFITAKRGTPLNGANPTILYAYGGFNIPVTPGFSVPVATWLSMGGVYAVANIRGGGEYGRTWHESAIKTRRTVAFDDFASAAEHLIAEKWTAPQHLAINGRSNGGLLVAATAMRRPELFAAAIPGVGVLDMIRFRDFTIGWAWESDYGSVKNADEFATLYGYSPLHNLKSGVEYPAMMILTGDHDDRVYPAHSFKYAAALQHAYQGGRPMLIRIETRGGHGAGKPVSMQISENADWMAFVAARTGLDTAR